MELQKGRAREGDVLRVVAVHACLWLRRADTMHDLILKQL